MTVEAIGQTAVRILGLFFLGQSIVALPNIYWVVQLLPNLNQPDQFVIAQPLVLQLSLVCVPAALGTSILIRSRRLSSWIVSVRIDSERNEGILDMSQPHATALHPTCSLPPRRSTLQRFPTRQASDQVSYGAFQHTG